MTRPHGLFWVKGNPGAGKSVLMKHAVKRLKERSPDELVVAFYLHGQGVELQKSPVGLFRALLNFLLEQFAEYLAQLTARFEEREKRYGSYREGRWQWKERELQDTLFNVLTEGTQRQPVVIFVDALDECGEASARSLLAYFRDVTEQAGQRNGLVRICLSSRHYPILSPNSVSSVTVEDWNKDDIRWYTQERLKYIKPKVKSKQIEEEILTRAAGGFQWVSLVTETIIDKTLAGMRAERLLQELASCPQTLGELYAAILMDIRETERSQMMKAFYWVLFAKRPLSAQELRDALATDKDMAHTSIHELRSHEGWSETLSNFESYVRHISGGLIRFQSREIWEQYVPGENSDREAQLIHQSVADFLLEKFLNKINYDRHIFRSYAAAGHFQISRSCLRYMMLMEVLEETHLSRGAFSSKFPLAPYAVRFLFEHIQGVEREGINQVDLLSILRWTPKSEVLQKLSRAWRILDPGNAHTPMGWPFVEATPMHVLVAFGSNSSIIPILSIIDEVDGRDPNGNTPLMMAIREGHQDIASTLLDCSFRNHKNPGQVVSQYGTVKRTARPLLDVNAKNKDDDTVLDIAVEQGATAIIHKLFEAGADLQYREREIGLVRDAISSGNIALLSKLIDRGINLNGTVYFALGNFPLGKSHALYVIVQMLLEAGANMHRLPELETEQEDHGDESRFDEDALILASRQGMTKVVNLLLYHGASASAENQIGQTSLMVATQKAHEKIIRTLLQEAPFVIERLDNDNRSALGIAYDLEGSNLSMLLLEKGEFFNPSPVLERFFKHMVQDGQTDFIEAILQRDVFNTNHKIGNSIYTPLFFAVINGHKETAELLLSTGKVDVNAKSTDGHTPLSLAASKGKTAIIKLLLEDANVNVHSKDGNGCTPLLLAASKGHNSVVKLLLEDASVDVNAQNNDGYTPLLLASLNGHQIAVRLLLEATNIDVDSANSDGETPLLLAASKGHTAIVKMLLETDKSDVNARAIKDFRPLSYAIIYHHEAIVKLLLDTGRVDVDYRDQYNRTPLLWAVEKGEEAIVKLLVNTGKTNVDIKYRGKRELLVWAHYHGWEETGKLLRSIIDGNVSSEDEKG